MNLGQAKKKAFKLLNEYSTNGTPITSANGSYQDYALRMNDVANDAQMEIARFIKIPAVHQITHYPPENLLGLHAGFGIEQYNPGMDKSYVGTGAQSYYFEVDRPCTVYIEELRGGTWTELKEITITNISSFTGYKGNLTLTSTSNPVRLRFTGDYPYLIRHRALFKYNYPSDDAVPVYKAFIPYDLPSDFMEFDKIMRWFDDRQYQPMTSDFKFTGKKTIEINWFLNGQFDMHYFRLPAVIDDETPDTYEFEIDPQAQNLIPYYIAAHTGFDEKQTISTFLQNQYENKLANLSSGYEQSQTGTIIDTKGW
jgi:hypothetical protein